MEMVASPDLMRLFELAKSGGMYGVDLGDKCTGKTLYLAEMRMNLILLPYLGFLASINQ